jgi:pimeloyl-ACP methyl ester carboxylesterase
MTTQHLERPGGTIAYDDSGGDGELVVMLPGMGALRSEYRALAPVLREAGYRTVTADLRGHGDSSASWSSYTLTDVGEDLLALIDHLDAGPAHAVGTSFSPGSMVWAAAERPEIFRSLVLIGAFVRDPKTTALQRLMMATLFGGPWRVAAWVAYYRTLYPTRQPDDLDAYLRSLKANLREPGRISAVKAMAVAPKSASAERLDRVDTPSLVVMGTKDPDWPDAVAEARFIAERLSAELLLVEGAGHYPQTEMPDTVAPAVVDFLASVTPAPSSAR